MRSSTGREHACRLHPSASGLRHFLACTARACPCGVRSQVIDPEVRIACAHDRAPRGADARASRGSPPGRIRVRACSRRLTWFVCIIVLFDRDRYVNCVICRQCCMLTSKSPPGERDGGLAPHPGRDECTEPCLCRCGRQKIRKRRTYGRRGSRGLGTRGACAAAHMRTPCAARLINEAAPPLGAATPRARSQE